MIRAVLFDLDDTLIPEASAVRASLEAACAPFEEGLSLPAGVLAESVTAVAEANFAALDVTGIEASFGVTWEECLWGRLGAASQAQIPALPALAQMLRRSVWSDALVACGIRSPIGAELEARFIMERRKSLRPFEGAAELIQALRDRALLVGCATNGASEIQREKLAVSGTLAWFDAVTISGEEGIGKPDPRILLRLCEELELQPDEAIYVGNSPRRDVAAAEAAGMRSILVERFEPEEEIRDPLNQDARVRAAAPLPLPDATVYEVQGLLGFLDGWRAGRAFRIFEGGLRPLSVDEPSSEEGGFRTRVGPESDGLRPSIRGESRAETLEAGLRSLRARSEGRDFRHELGEPIDWDALLR